MEVTGPIQPSLQDEHVIAIDPPLKPDQPGVWRRRINAFTGRALSEKALTAEQDMRAGMQRLHGLSMTAGVVDGLTVMADIDALGAPPAAAKLQLFAGIGVTRMGEDVSIGTTRQFALADIPIIVPVDVANKLSPSSPPTINPQALRVAATGGAASAPADDSAPKIPPFKLARPMLSTGAARLNALRPIRALSLPAERDGLPMAKRLLPAAPRQIYGTLGKALEIGAAAQMPRVGILVAQPIDATILGRQTGDCPPDPRDDPYSDLQRVDGTRLLLFMWPSEMSARNSGPDYSLPPIGSLRRNQLAYRVFDMERTFQGEEMHPWEEWGVPIAMVGFREDWALDFIDRASVVRVGGAPRPRSTLVPFSGEAGLWQARIDQMIEQLGSLKSLDAGTLRETFQRVPPASVLPADCYDPVIPLQSFFPSGFGTNAIPIPKSSLETAIKEAAGLLPFNLSVADRVEILIPVPDELYDPGLLAPEEIDGSFETKIETFRMDRDRWLIAREIVRRRYDRLREGVSGMAMSWPAISMPDSEFCPEESTTPPLSATRIRNYSAIGGVKAHSVETSATLGVETGDTIWFWVRFRTAPVGLSLRLAQTANVAPGSYTHIAYWGDPDGQEAGTTARKVDKIPPTAGWIKLEAGADRVWTASNTSLAGLKIGAIEFAQKGGDVDYGPMGKTDTNGRTTIWIGDDVRGTATFRQSSGGTTATEAPWEWRPVEGREVESLPDFGTQLIKNARSVTAIDTFKAEQTQTWLKADIARIDENGLDAYIDELAARLKATNDAIDVGFTRARSDTYRVRQFMLGADSASRLVTSPTLADLAKRDEGARVTGVGISDFINKAMKTEIKAFDFVTPITKVLQPETPATRNTFNAVEAKINVISEVEATAQPVNTMMMMAQPMPMMLNTFPMMTTMMAAPSMSAISGAAAGRSAPAMAVDSGRNLESRVAAAPVSSGFANVGLSVMQPQVPLASLALFNQPTLPSAISLANIAGFATDFSARDIRAQRPAPGLVERTLSVAERLTQPPAVQALEYAVASKAAVIQTLRGLMLRQNGRPDGIALDGIFVPGYAFKKAGTTTNEPDLAQVPPKLEQLIDKISDFVDIDDVRDKLKTGSAKHESDYFTAAIQTIDNAIALMRLVEDRVAFFERLLEQVRDIRATTMRNLAEASAQLRLIDTEVEEARHDLATAQSLFEEEGARIKALDERRKAILKNHVSMIAYRRVRESNHRSFGPTLKLGSGLAENAIAACRREHPDTPVEVSDYIGLFRDAPVKWFPRIAAEVSRIDRAEAAAKAIERARQQALLEQARQAAQMQFQVQQMQIIQSMPLLLQTAQKMHIVQHQALVARRIKTASLDVAAIPRFSLAESHREFGENATLGDAADSTHKAPTLEKMATELLQDVAGVAACLHAEFAETPAAARLEWAETLSQYDGQVDMQSLASLPNWGRIDRDQRKQLQMLASWLFLKIDRSNPKAVALISDLVRITLLLAAHSPVKRLIPARLVGESPARVGTRLMLDVDIRQIRKGMAAIVRDRQNRIVSRAVIEDMIEGRASARIINVAPHITTIFPEMRVELATQVLRMAK